MAYLKKLFLILFCVRLPNKVNKYIKNISLAEKQQKEETNPNEQQQTYSIINLLDELDLLSISNLDELEKRRKETAQGMQLLGNIDLGYGKLGEGTDYENLQKELGDKYFGVQKPGYGHIEHEELSHKKIKEENIQHDLLKTIKDEGEMFKETERKDNVNILRTFGRADYEMWPTSSLGHYGLYDSSRLGTHELLERPLWGNYDLFGCSQRKYEEEEKLVGADRGRNVDEKVLREARRKYEDEEKLIGSARGRNVHEKVLGKARGKYEEEEEEFLGAVGGKYEEEEKVLGAVGGREEQKERAYKNVKYKYSKYGDDSYKGKYEEKRDEISFIPRFRTWRSRSRGEGHSTDNVMPISDSSKGAIPKQDRSVKHNKKDHEYIPEDLEEEYEEEDEDDEEEQKKRVRKNRDLGKKDIYKFEESLSYIVNDTSVEISSDDVDEFRNVIITSKDINQKFHFTLIEEYLGLGISKKDDIQRMCCKYPLYKGEKINFKDLRNPFRIEHPYLKEMESIYACEMLFFDDFLCVDLSSFLSEHKVGNLTLQKIIKIFREEGIKYLYFSEDTLKYVNYNYPDFNLYKFLNLYKKNYFDRDEHDICDFSTDEFPLIKENNKRTRAILLDLRRRSLIRSLTRGEKQLLKSIIYEEKKTFSLIRKILGNFTLIINKIRRDYSNATYNISSNGTLLPRDEYLLQSAYYILNYCLSIVKPFYDKIIKKQKYNYKEIARLSGTVNSLINILEFIEHNSALYNDLLDRCKCLQSFYPRVHSEEGLISFYRYAIAKIEIIALVFDINVILTKMHKCEMLVKEYERYTFPSYHKLLTNTEILLNDAERILFENN
ncbi:conserved Plasmodium protein, unknown function [Plasmodium sp. gorilla clade G2]|uniref:conserved Plasmodium protein, unknown function n=1 Tax=Plasmodium sp. gorilla clade G2 TaxID=880535 RepID=UPI000D202D39|nr:conserved Plasmodium protein, unknown function [Plasmodium sp. gorilla clade G2]SOV19973.1 conserved Plasmodium protein, unknown function [Plasmodium sp. gorilla clade G2]